ncbi:MAG: type II toxin-antitoxin system RelE/ParE family toxin [Candidatus Marinimicrobia bacterium]|nr:type II toxin-antitoxin system RelE/ParE family toxin [Candidatus Neomarinimicrobiota bacterium]
MYKIFYTNSYIKLASRFLKKHPELEKQYSKTLQVLEVNPYHPSLRMHKLTGKLGGIHSVSINIQYRITIQFIIKEKTIIPIMLGKHEDVY